MEKVSKDNCWGVFGILTNFWVNLAFVQCQIAIFLGDDDFTLQRMYAAIASKILNG